MVDLREYPQYTFRPVERQAVEGDIELRGPFDGCAWWHAQLLFLTYLGSRDHEPDLRGYEIHTEAQRPRRVDVVNALTHMKPQRWTLGNPDMLLAPVTPHGRHYACYRVVTAKRAGDPRPLFLAIPVMRRGEEGTAAEELALILYDQGAELLGVPSYEQLT